MRKNIVAGNWKMNKNFPEGIELIKDILEQSKKVDKSELIVSPPYIFLSEAASLLSNSNIGLAAQNCSNNESGAYTGEISASMLSSVGANHVVLGHSERRAYYGETDESINQKIKLCIAKNLNPIVCCGEVLQERENKEHFEVVANQLKGMFENISPEEFKNVIIAYEPVWAIGTGKTPALNKPKKFMNLYGKQLKTHTDRN